MDIRKIKKLIELLEGSNLSEIEIHEGEGSVRISRHTTAESTNQTTGSIPASVITAQPTNVSVNNITQQEPTITETVGHKITAPMVGTFFRANSPKDSPFVEVGSQVKVGDPLCIIEAMKMLNQIESDKDGVIKTIAVENGHSVEFGQLLFTIE